MIEESIWARMRGHPPPRSAGKRFHDRYRHGDGHQLPIVAGSVLGTVDSSQKVVNPFLGESARLSGWAASAKGHDPASSILVFSAGRFLGAFKPTINRPDVAKNFRNQAAERSGYVLDLPLTLLEHRGKVATVELLATHGGVASRLPFTCDGKPGQIGC